MFEGIHSRRACARSGGSSAWSEGKQRSMELPSAGCSAAAGEVVLLRMKRRGGLYLLLLCWILSAQPAAHGKRVVSHTGCLCALAWMRVCAVGADRTHTLLRVLALAGQIPTCARVRARVPDVATFRVKLSDAPFSSFQQVSVFLFSAFGFLLSSCCCCCSLIDCGD